MGLFIALAAKTETIFDKLSHFVLENLLAFIVFFVVVAAFISIYRLMKTMVNRLPKNN